MAVLLKCLEYLLTADASTEHLACSYEGRASNCAPNKCLASQAFVIGTVHDTTLVHSYCISRSPHNVVCNDAILVQMGQL